MHKLYIYCLCCYSSPDTSCSLPNGDDHWGCCNAANLCDIDEGDCDDVENQCKDGLYCGKDNCPAGFPSTMDCCTGKLMLGFDTAHSNSTREC